MPRTRKIDTTEALQRNSGSEREPGSRTRTAQEYDSLLVDFNLGDYGEAALHANERRATVRNRLQAAAKRGGFVLRFRRTSGPFLVFKVEPEGSLLPRRRRRAKETSSDSSTVAAKAAQTPAATAHASAQVPERKARVGRPRKPVQTPPAATQAAPAAQTAPVVHDNETMAADRQPIEHPRGRRGHRAAYERYKDSRRANGSTSATGNSRSQSRYNDTLPRWMRDQQSRENTGSNPSNRRKPRNGR